MTDAKAQLVSSWLTKAKHDLDVPEPSREQFDRAISASEGLYEFVISLLPTEVRPK